MGSELRSLVDQELNARAADTQTLALWSSIFDWYEDGGPNKVEDQVRRLLAQTTRAVKKGMREVKEAAPAKRSRKRRR